MSKSSLRKGLSKKIRFEVFKRDKFICQYCGESAPNVLLQLDHIEPVAKGGTNDIANLITSCFECNNGKRDRQLSDDSVVQKQRKQLELLQERREQIELMFEWKKSLSQLDGYTVQMVIEYIDSKMFPHSVSENGKKSVEVLLKKFTFDKILDAIDLSATRYLKISAEGEITKDNAELFFEKIGGILHLQKMPPIQQKLAYIKGIAKNRFNYFDPRRASIELNEYVDALRNSGYDDDDVLKDLEEELIPETIKAQNWSGWMSLLEGWIDSLNKKRNEIVEEKQEFDYDTLKIHVQSKIEDIHAKEQVLILLGNSFPEFNKNEFISSLYSTLIEYLESIENFTDQQFLQYKNGDAKIAYITEYSARESITKHFNIDWEKVDFSFYNELDSIVTNLIYDVFERVHFPRTNYSKKDILIQINMLKDYLGKKRLEIA